MDATDQEADITIQKSAKDLLAELETLLPRILFKNGKTDEVVPRVLSKDVEKAVELLTPFQESPQLLDPHLARITSQLTSAFLLAITSSFPSPFLPSSQSSIRKHIVDALSIILYTLVKIRGYKVIVRFFPSEPRWLDPLSTLLESKKVLQQGQNEDTSTWETSYILLLWLAHLSLAPFDLATISEDEELVEGDYAFPKDELVGRIPALATRLLRIAVDHVGTPSLRVSDAAALVLVRVGLRRDMRALGVLDEMLTWCFSTLQDQEATLFTKTGIMKVIAGVLSQGDRAIVRSYCDQVYEFATSVEDGQDEPDPTNIWNSATIRNLVMKLYRWVAILLLPPLGASASEGGLEESEEGVVEEIIGRLLGALGDRDTTVRMSASKSLSSLSGRLPEAMAGEVAGAILDTYQEDLLTDSSGAVSYAAVSAEKWHGLTLTLATFLRQRVFKQDTTLLARALACVLSALSFEQRRISFAAGGNVRDAANYAAWSLARNYSTSELLTINIQEMDYDYSWTGIGKDQGVSLIQLFAVALIITACLDPVGNIRRGASAALQELVGRHPNTVRAGIQAVQTVDYLSVALRRRSTIDVAFETAQLDEIYWRGLTAGLVRGWRGVGAADAPGRKIAGASLERLVGARAGLDGLAKVWEEGLEILDGLLARAEREAIKDVEIRHGSFIAIAHVVDSLTSIKSQNPELHLRPDQQQKLLNIFHFLAAKDLTYAPLRPELTLECTSSLISSLARATPSLIPAKPSSLRTHLAILDVALTRTDPDILLAASYAARSFLHILSTPNRTSIVSEWCRRITATQGRGTRGFITALGQIVDILREDGGHGGWDVERAEIISVLIVAARDREVEGRCAAVESLANGVLARAGSDGLRSKDNPELLAVIEGALDDYSVDARGDVGSWVRMKGVDAAVSAYQSGFFIDDPSGLLSIARRLSRLSAEKIDKIRVLSFGALQLLSTSIPELEKVIKKETTDLFTATKKEYFIHLLHDLASIPSLQDSVLEGYLLTAGSASESILRMSWDVLIEYLLASSHSRQRSILQTFISHLRRSVNILPATKDSDRVVTCALEVLATLGELGLWESLRSWRAEEDEDSGKGVGGGVGGKNPLKALLILTQKSAFKSSNIHRLSVAIRIYTSLALVSSFCSSSSSSSSSESKIETTIVKDAKTRLLALLGNKLPRVRARAAEGVWVIGEVGGWGGDGEGDGREGEGVREVMRGSEWVESSGWKVGRERVGGWWGIA